MSSQLGVVSGGRGSPGAEALGPAPGIPVAEEYGGEHPKTLPRRRAMTGLVAVLARASEVGFLALSLFLFSGALLPLLLRESGASVGGAEGNPVLRATFAGVHAVTLLLVLARWRSVLAVLRRNGAVIALVCVAVASVAWSDAPELTLRRSVALVATTSFGVYLAACHGVRGTLRVLALALGTVAILSFVFAIALPSYGIDVGPHAGAWRGVFNQKNNLGQAMVLSTVAFLLLARASERRRWVGWAGAAGSALLVLLSTSGTALVILLGFAALLPLFRALRWRASTVQLLLIGLVLAGAGIGLWVVGNAEMLLTALGKDPTLTGRTDLWMAVMDQIRERPLLGHGYSAFWLGWGGASADVWKVVRWETPHAHNGFLDLGLDLGLVGLALFATGFAVAVTRAVRLLRATRSAESIWPLALLSFMLLYNVTETAILQQNSIYWTLFVAAVFSVPVSSPSSPPAAGTGRGEIGGANPLPAASRLSPGLRRRLARAR